MKATTETASTNRIFLAFAAIAFAFVSSTLYANWRTLAIHSETETLVRNCVPSIENLEAAIDALHDIEEAADAYPDLPIEKQAAAHEAIDLKWAEVDKRLAAYIELPAFEGERELFDAAVPPSLRSLEGALSKLYLQVAAREIAPAHWTVDHQIRMLADRASRVLRHLLRNDAAYAYTNVARIEAIRRSASLYAVGLDFLNLLLVGIVSTWVWRLQRSHGALAREHSLTVGRRADELELFGKRVAHDLLSPLVALSYCLVAFKRASEADPKLKEAMVRASSCITRAQRMVDGIFEFARAGGQPESNATADIRETIEQVCDEIRNGDPTNLPEITIEEFDSSTVACSRGVMTSLVSNLLRNATKYMSDSAVKKITVRVIERDERVRIEVEDSGPGVPAGLETAIFEPYVRAEGVTQAGLGLGLATVKRLSEAHGGEVGVRSGPGGGAIFWFVLPLAAARVSTAMIRRAS
ncbi:MAG: HAMP domain-containing sensor histidine kinase [Polyangiaceae bacterium]